MFKPNCTCKLIYSLFIPALYKFPSVRGRQISQIPGAGSLLSRAKAHGVPPRVSVASPEQLTCGVRAGPEIPSSDFSGVEGDSAWSTPCQSHRHLGSTTLCVGADLHSSCPVANTPTLPQLHYGPLAQTTSPRPRCPSSTQPHRPLIHPP